MKHLILIFLVILLPSAIFAKEKKHIEIPADQECSDCHTAQAQVWMEGKHGLMNVKCVICHDSSDKAMIAKKDIYKCRGCHGQQVKDVEEKLPAQARNCYLCHNNHSLNPIFHTKGGKE